ncbi:cytochrome b [Paraburkholderia phosphatilytica]|uniref:cytochrome b n=1 Tax=Paraburkholderia phosphatilytica TaxID=2282883 RepID=UPI000E49F30E
MPTRYDGVARTLHWAIVMLIVAQFLLGWTMPDIHRNTTPDGLIAWHLTVGATIVVAMALRVLWRVTHRPPPPPDDLPVPLSVLSRATHLLLYAALVAVPVLGWINASSRGWKVALPGGVGLPALSASGSSFGHSMGDVHSLLAWVLLVLIGLHVAAALFHRFVLRDRTMQRMLPWPAAADDARVGRRANDAGRG